MIIIEKIQIDHIPTLHIVQKEAYNKKLPFVIFIHGFTSAKEHNLHFAYSLAEKGFRVVLPDCLYHGERETGLGKMKLNMQFWNIVLQTMDEIETIKNTMEEKGLINREKIGLIGTSMGAIITLGALTRYPWINSAVSLMGMPYYEKFAQYTMEQIKKQGVKLPLSETEINDLLEKLSALDLSKQPEKLQNRPLMFWHSEVDQVVPYKYSSHFHEEIKSIYRKQPENLVYYTDKHAGHKVTRSAMLKTVTWFSQHLLEK